MHQSRWLTVVIARRQTRSRWADLLLLGVRLYAGITIASAGLDKLPTPEWMVDQVVQMNLFPAPSLFAFLACYAEFVCGVLLAFGLLTPVASLLLAFTLGVAAFGFHKVLPLTGMHIAQGFFWLFVVFLAVGPGRFSVDHTLGGLLTPREGGRARRGLACLLGGSLLLIISGYGLYREFLYAAPVRAEPVMAEIETVSVVGSFNQWDLLASPMTRQEDAVWSITIPIAEAGSIEFKFAANESWDFSVGDEDQDSAGFPLSGVGEPGAGNVRAYIPKPGPYQFSVNVQTFAYELRLAGEPR